MWKGLVQNNAMARRHNKPLWRYDCVAAAAAATAAAAAAGSLGPCTAGCRCCAGCCAGGACCCAPGCASCCCSPGCAARSRTASRCGRHASAMPAAPARNRPTNRASPSVKPELVCQKRRSTEACRCMRASSVRHLSRWARPCGWKGRQGARWRTQGQPARKPNRPSASFAAAASWAPLPPPAAPCSPAPAASPTPTPPPWPAAPRSAAPAQTGAPRSRQTCLRVGGLAGRGGWAPANSKTPCR